MKLIKHILLSTILGLICVSCSNSEYKNAIPKNAKTVVAIDLKKLSSNFELPEEFIKEIEPFIGFLINGSDVDDLIEMIKGDKDSGIDFSVPFYLYMTSDKSIGASFKVDDDDDLEELFNIFQRHNLTKKLVEKDGVMWTSLLDDISVAYDDNTLSLLMGNNLSQTKKTQQSLFDLPEEDSFASTEQFEKIESKDGAVRCLYNLDAFVDYEDKSSSEYVESMKSFLPDGVRLVDVDVVGDLILDKGLINFDFEIFSPVKKTQKLLEKEDDKFKKIKGDFIGAPNDFVCWMSMGVNGEDLVSKLKNFDVVKEFMFALERGIDIEKILKSVKGDMAIMIPAISENMDFVMTAKVKNTDFLKDVNYWNETMKDYGMKMTETSKNNYILHTGDFDLNWGADDNNVYFSSSSSFYRSAFSEKSDKLKAVEKDVKNSIFYAYLNLDGNFTRNYLDKFDTEDFNLFDYLSVSAKNSRQFSISLVLKNKDKGLLEQVIDNFMKQLKSNS